MKIRKGNAKTLVVTSLLITALAVPTLSFGSAGGDTASTENGTESAETVQPIADMTFITPAIELSLEGAYEKLASSSTMALKEVEKKMNQAVANGSMEASSAISSANDNPLTFQSTSAEVTAAANRDYAKAMVEPNHEARINAFNLDIFKQYYELKHAEEGVQIAKDNMDLSAKLLENTNLKYSVGTVSKVDVLTAEMNAKTAADTYQSASDGLATAKMYFNTTFGYDLMQGVTLTNELEEVPLPETTLGEAIDLAKQNRIEVLATHHGVIIAEANMKAVNAYPKYSAAYLNAESNLIFSQHNKDNAPDNIEMDVRTKYMNMMTSYQKVQSGKQNVSNSQESARLAQLQYDSGIATLTTVQQANLGSYNAQLDYANALLDYNVAVEEFTLSYGVGTTVMNM